MLLFVSLHDIDFTHRFSYSCNVEGIHFMNDEMLMAVSDKMKSKGRQDFRCASKDQSIHAFVIP